MDISTKRGKEEIIKRHSPKSRLFSGAVRAFLFGGSLCALGEGLYFLFSAFLDPKISRVLVSLSFILIAAILTALGVFDRIAKWAGAGTLVPITGFSNATVSEAIDAGSEGLVLGVGAKIFTVSGPVILFGVFSGVLYGIIYFLVLKIAELF